MSAIRARNTIESPPIYTEWPKLNSLPQELKINYDLIVNKPFLIKVIDWSTTDNQYASILNVGFPSSSWVNDQIRVPFETAAKYRLKACLYAQVMGTPQHQGTVLVSVMPYNTIAGSYGSVNSLMQSPHVFLSANESTPACVEIPFYSNTKLQNTDSSRHNTYYQYNSDYAQLQLMVINPLQTSGSTTVTISLHVVFTEAEFYIPKNDGMTFITQGEETASNFTRPITSFFDSVTRSLKHLTGDFIDNGRKFLREYTGLHSPNIGAPSNRVIMATRNFHNNVDVPVYYEKLDTHVDHDKTTKDFSFYTPQDEMLISHIVSKPQYIDTIDVPTTTTVNTLLFSRPITPIQQMFADRYVNIPLQTLAMLSKYWKGGLRLHIQSSMTGFHNCKLMIARDYSNDKRMFTGFPNPFDVVNLQTDTIEFSAGGQVQTVDLPYCSLLNQTQVSFDEGGNAMSHGVYYIYLMQPIVSSPNVPSSISFNFYISAMDDFQLYGLSTFPFEMTSQAESLAQPSSQEDIVNIVSSKQEVDDSDFKPLVSVRDYIRRLVPLPPIVTPTFDTPDGFIYVIPISNLLQNNVFTSSYYNYMGIIRKFYMGIRGGFKFKFYVGGVNDACLRYFPPHTYVDGVSGQWLSASLQPTSGTIIPYFKLMAGMPAIGSSTLINAYPVPYIENGTSYTPSYTQDFTTVSPAVTRHYALGNVQLECTVPINTSLDFVGTGETVSQSADRSYARDFGTIVIAVNTVPSGNSMTYPKPFISPYFGYSDDTRFGFNVYSPEITLPTVDVDPLHYSTGPYFDINGDAFYTDLTAAGYSYYGGINR